MEWKKILFIPVSFITIHFLYISCCNCVDSNTPYVEIKNLAVSPSGSGNIIVDSGVPVTTDSINLYYFISRDCIADRNLFSAFINPAFAFTTCKCRGCGYEGFKSKIKKMEITSDSVYNGIAAGNSLNDLFKEKETDANNNYVYISMDSLKSRLNQVVWLDNVFLTTTMKPRDAHGHKFTLTIQAEDNKVVSATTKRIYWY